MTEMLCGDTCVDAKTDPKNCGECGRTCLFSENPFAGGCLDGECLPFYSGCVSSSDGLSTCDEVCAASGQSCRDDDDAVSCGIVGFVWTEGNEDACMTLDFGQGATLSWRAPIIPIVRTQHPRVLASCVSDAHRISNVRTQRRFVQSLRVYPARATRNVRKGESAREGLERLRESDVVALLVVHVATDPRVATAREAEELALPRHRGGRARRGRSGGRARAQNSKSRQQPPWQTWSSGQA